MGKPVVCPHCGSCFQAQPEPGHPFCLCPRCGRWMSVNLRLRPRKKPGSTKAKCPFCGAQLALGGDTCLNCQRQVFTGEMLPLFQRLRLVPTGKKMAVLSGVLAGLVALIVLVNLTIGWIRHLQRPSRPVTMPSQTAADEAAARKLVDALVAATDDVEVERLGSTLGKSGSVSVPFILKAMDRADVSDHARRAMIVALGEIKDPKAGNALADALTERPFHETALISLAQIGDARALEPMYALYTSNVRYTMLADTMANRALLPLGVNAASLQRHWSEALARVRRPMACLGRTALPQLLAGYWSARQWLPRDRGQYWLEQLDRVLEQMTLSAGPDAVLDDLLVGQPAEVRLASAMLLRKRRPTIDQTAEQRATKLADLLVHNDLTTRRRAIWVLSCLTGKTFADFSWEREPIWVSPDALKQACEWVRRKAGTSIEATPDLLAQTHPPELPKRSEYHPARIEARRLTAGLLNAEWPAAREKYRALRDLPPDAAPVVRDLLNRDPKDFGIPARLVVLQLLSQWRDAAATEPIGRLGGLKDNPPWMPAWLAISRAATSRNPALTPWLEAVYRLDPILSTQDDPQKGPTLSDLADLLAPMGKPALVAMRRSDAFRRPGSSLARLFTTTADTMSTYGWPVSAWLAEPIR